MKLDFLKGDFEMASLFTELVRWFFVVLAIFILVRAIASLLRTKILPKCGLICICALTGRMKRGIRWTGPK